MLVIYIGYIKISDTKEEAPRDEIKVEGVDKVAEAEGDGNKSDRDNLLVDSIKKEANGEKKQVENWDSNRVERDGEHRTKLSDKKIGKIEIERVRIEMPIYAGASEVNLMRGVATVDYKEGLNERTVGIAGHVGGRYQFFTEIKQLVKGDIIKIRDYENSKDYKYKVSSNYQVNPMQREILKDNKGKKARKLVLITCHNYDSELLLFTQRWIVEAYEV